MFKSGDDERMYGSGLHSPSASPGGTRYAAVDAEFYQSYDTNSTRLDKSDGFLKYAAENGRPLTAPDDENYDGSVQFDNREV